jgi:hypothetical protein
MTHTAPKVSDAVKLWKSLPGGFTAACWLTTAALSQNMS